MIKNIIIHNCDMKQTVFITVGRTLLYKLFVK